MIAFLPTRAIAVQVGPLSVHWYGIMYLLAFLIVWWAVPLLQKHRGLKLGKDDLSTLLIYGVLGTILGGRLGYVLLYAPAYFSHHPLEILAIWKGGMASHGGFLGVGLALLLYCRRYRIDFWALCDVLVIPIAVGLALGRIGNFINEELYGVVTDLPWCMEFRNVAGCRHPTQIYAVTKDLAIALLCYAHLCWTVPRAQGTWEVQRSTPSGCTAGLFLIFYGTLRFLVEFLRAQTVPPSWVGFAWITYGQLLTIPIIAAGVAIILWRGLIAPRGA